MKAMFTGIIEERGVVVDIKHKQNLCILRVKVKKIQRGLKIGESVAVNGVCLTVTKIHQRILIFDIMRETILRTTLKDLRPRSGVNLERALKADSRFGGHFVTGHVDGVGVISGRLSRPNYVELIVQAPKDLLRYVVPKGSICLDGVSLTVGKVTKKIFSVYLIPYTFKVTTLGTKKLKNKVNIETDILARYVLK